MVLGFTPTGSVILVSHIFAVNPNKHYAGIHLCLSGEDLCLGIILLCWSNSFKEFWETDKIRS